LGKLVQTSVIEGQKIFNGPPPKAGIGKIVKSGLFSRYGMQKIFADSFLHVIVINLFFKEYGSKNFLASLFLGKNRAPLRNFTGGLRRFR
jgi:hypothetical protein